MRSVADAISITLVLSGFVVGLVVMYYQARFYDLWRTEMLARTPKASYASLAFAWFYAPFLDNVSAKCNVLRRRANWSVVAFLTAWAVGFVFMYAMHSIGVYPAKPPS
jgi:hypothetical protein